MGCNRGLKTLTFWMHLPNAGRPQGGTSNRLSVRVKQMTTSLCSGQRGCVGKGASLTGLCFLAAVENKVFPLDGKEKKLAALPQLCLVT